jgi:hypothetical protein
MKILTVHFTIFEGKRYLLRTRYKNKAIHVSPKMATGKRYTDK